MNLCSRATSIAGGLLSVTLLLAACGQTGPLYLPEDAATEAAPAAVPSSAPADESSAKPAEEQEQTQGD